MATHRSGYDCDFVERPPEAFQSECPVCLLILCDPYQVSCCGNGFCQGCIEQVKADSSPYNCPCCKAETFEAFEDKRLKRSLYGFRVYCANRQHGCQWVGELGLLDNHLNSNPSKQKQLEGCLFCQVKCIHCSKLFQRSSIEIHQNDQCPKRPFSCQYCKDYTSSYKTVVTKHWPVCRYYPVQCLIKCGKMVERQNLEQHINSDCPLTVTDCDFKNIGCDVRLSRKDMPAHLNDCAVKHVSLQVAHYKQTETRLEEDNKQLKQELARLGEESKQLRQQVVKLAQDLQMQQIWKHVVVRLEEDNNELKQQVATLEKECQQLKHQVVNLAQDLQIRKQVLDRLGEEIKHLKQQAEQSQQFQQQLQDENKHLQQKVEESKQFQHQIVRLEEGIKQQIAKLTQDHQISKHTEEKEDKQFKQQVRKESKQLQQHVLRLEEELKQQIVKLAQDLQIQQICTPICPVEMTMANFGQHMKDKDRWYSLPYYTHLKGYKMCLCVDANGNSGGCGTHTSIIIFLMKGEFDRHLKWPFRGTLTVLLLDQEAEERHLTGTVNFDDKVPDDVACRVKEGDRAKRGCGISKFILHTNLQPVYLKNDCLKLHIEY